MFLFFHICVTYSGFFPHFQICRLFVDLDFLRAILRTSAAIAIAGVVECWSSCRKAALSFELAAIPSRWNYSLCYPTLTLLRCFYVNVHRSGAPLGPFIFVHRSERRGRFQTGKRPRIRRRKSGIEGREAVLKSNAKMTSTKKERNKIKA